MVDAGPPWFRLRIKLQAAQQKRILMRKVTRARITRPLEDFFFLRFRLGGKGGPAIGE
jgi:hypothetical protein